VSVPLLLIFSFTSVLLSAFFSHVHVVVFFFFRIDFELVTIHHTVLTIDLLSIIASVSFSVIFVSYCLSIFVNVELECFVIYDVADNLE